jgi:carotenoid cleavage dioxygenase-like enzyme
MLESPNYIDSVNAGELIPQVTLNKFTNPEDEWNFIEKTEIMYGMTQSTAFDNFNPAVWRFGTKEDPIYTAVTDFPAALWFNISDLSTNSMLYPEKMPIATAGCAHPMREPGTDNTINFMVKMTLTGTKFIEVQRYTTDFEHPQVIATFEPKKTSMIHSFSITEQYVVFFFYPVDIDSSQIWAQNFHLMEAIKWETEDVTDIYIVDLHSGEVRTMETEFVYSLHHTNAYQFEDYIVIDMCLSDPSALRDTMKVEYLFNPPAETNWTLNPMMEFSRYTLNLNTNDVTKTTFSNKINSVFVQMFDFPVINEQYRGKQYCYVYAVSQVDYTRTALVKKHVCDDSTGDKIWYKENHYVTEVWFLPSREATPEDDGILFTTAFDGELERSYIMLLDAVNLEVVATSYLPHNIPWSAHGMHFPEAQF